MCWSHNRHWDAWERPVSRAGRAPVVPEPFDLRASDADRERVVEALRAHAAAGRLSPDELEDRVERAYAASTRADLHPLLEDLPADEAPPAGERRRPSMRPEWVAFVVVAVALLTIWALTGAGAFWPAWPLAFWGFALVGKQRRHGWHAGRPL